MDPQSTPGSVNDATNMPPQPPLPVPPPPLSGAGAADPVAPPLTAAQASWLPPTVPVQPSSGSGQSPEAVTGQSGQTLVPTPAVADDGDLIEKEWVQRAKHIVEQTRQDPYKQTRELHKFRAEYMKKRYNKIIEPVDE
jgi:hypothetical protein